MPSLSVVTPVYNAARYLTATLDSVARLTVPHEHIVVDGGSADGTVELLGAREDPALSWVSEPDRGQTDAVNKGFQRATRRPPRLAERRRRVRGGGRRPRGQTSCSARPELDAIYGAMQITDEEGGCGASTVPPRYSWRRYLYLGDYLPTPTIIFRRGLLERVGLLDEAYVDAADYDFYLRLFEQARVERARRRRSSASATTPRARPRAMRSAGRTRRSRSGSSGRAARTSGC